MFRNGYNDWAKHISNSWLSKEHLTYQNIPKQGAGYHTNGFVYQLVTNKASDKITKKVQITMKQAHREFIAVRKMTTNQYFVEYEKLNLVEKNFYLGRLVHDKQPNTILHLGSEIRRARREHLSKNAVLE